MNHNRSFRDLFSHSADAIKKAFWLPRNKTTAINGHKPDFLSAIYKSILSAESIEESISATIKEFKERFEFSNVSITLFDFKNAVFIPYGFKDRKEGVILEDGVALPLEEFNHLNVLEQHKTYLEQDLSKKSSVSRLERNMMEKEGLRSYFLCPLVGKGELIGSLNFGSTIEDAFSQETINFCEEVANGIAVSLYQYGLQSKIETINSELERKEKNITDSINYARRIQYSKLPSTEHIRECVPDCFVLYKPKDIVSGDFYHSFRTLIQYRF